MRANQKDNYFVSSLRSQIEEVVKIVKGNKYVNSYPEEITVFGKLIYYLATTVFGARTLGEEYVDIIYVNRLGKRFPRLHRRLMFMLSLVVLPYYVTKIARRLRAKNENTESSWLSKVLTSYPSLVDTIMNIHIAIFYFEGLFYSLSKRLFGMRYAFGHNKDPKQLQSTGNYSFLGCVMLLQFAVKMLIKFNQHMKKSSKDAKEGKSIKREEVNIYRTVESVKKVNQILEEDPKLNDKVSLDLADPMVLPYIPENSRNCMLCLSTMVNPSAANCGHMYCWDCIVDWVRERPECPLCRQSCLEQNLLPLR